MGLLEALFSYAERWFLNRIKNEGAAWRAG